MDRVLKCLRCKNDMEDGFIVDRGDGNNARVADWAKGKPKSGWLGLKNELREIQTFRCTNCGYLESYANSRLERA